MQTISLPKGAKLMKTEANKGTLVIEPCFPGFGLTIANALRRVLLSSLTGAAVTNVRIEGIEHEFSTLAGIKEDAINIVLNLKLLRFKLYTDKPVTLRLKLKGEGVATGADFKGSSEAEVVNGEQVIANLTDKKAQLDMEIIVKRGVGYLPVEVRENEEKVIGDIKVDATFTPIDKVSYKIENVRVGQATNYDRVLMEVETDGTVTAEDALKQAGKILVDHFCVLADLKKVDLNKKKKKATEATVKKVRKSEKVKIEAKLEEVKLSSRTLNSLLKAKYKKLSQLAKLTEEEFLAIPGVGENALKEIRRGFKKYGFDGFKVK